MLETLSPDRLALLVVWTLPMLTPTTKVKQQTRIYSNFLFRLFFWGDALMQQIFANVVLKIGCFISLDIFILGGGDKFYW